MNELNLFHQIVIFVSNFFSYPLAMITIGMCVMFIAVMFKILKESTITAENPKKSIALQKLAAIWLSQDEIKALIIRDVRREIGLEVKGKPPIVIGDSKLIGGINPDEGDDVVKITINDKNLLQCYSDTMSPFIKNSAYKSVIAGILQFLDSEGGVPSVYQKDVAYKKRVGVCNQYDVYSKITLAEHSVNVVRKAFANLKGRSKEQFGIYWAPLVICCLAHDIGKVPGSSPNYATAEHPKMSVELLKQIMAKSDVSPDDVLLFGDIQAAVATHHGAAKATDILSELLRLSDRQARDSELAAFLGENESVVDSAQAEPKLLTGNAGRGRDGQGGGNGIGDWFLLSEFIDILSKNINRILAGRVGSCAFTSGKVYFSIPLISDLFDEYAKSQGVSLPDKNTDITERQGLLVSLIGVFRENDFLFYKINSGHFTSTLALITHDGNKEGIPGVVFKHDVFTDDLSSLLKEKPEMLKDYKDVELTGAAKRV